MPGIVTHLSIEASGPRGWHPFYNGAVPSEDPEDVTPGSTERHAARAKAGEEGFDALYERLAPAIYAWATLRIKGSVRSRLEPEDVVQEVWWRAMDSFDSFDPAKGSFRPWIFQIATHTLLKSFRRMRVRGEMEDQHRRARLKALPEHLADQATSVSRRAARSEQVQVLLGEAAHLDDRDRLLFIHCALEGKKTPEAARIIGMTAVATAKRWQRLRQRLRGALASVGIHDPLP